MSGVKIQVRADARQAQTELQKLNTSMSSLDKRTKAVTSTFQKLAVGMAAAFGSITLVKGINRASDSMTEFKNRINLVTGDAKKTKTVLKELFDISKESRASVQGSVDTYSRFGLALKDAGKSSKDLITVTKAVQKAGIISGSSTQSANAAIIQLGQGLASGQLRGQELNSVLEQMPRLAQAIAKGMGIPFANLRKEAMAGKITAEEVFSAIIGQAKLIDKEFKLLDITVDGLAQVMRDRFSRAVGVLSKITGVSKLTKKAMVGLTNAFDLFAENAEKYLLAVRLNFAVFRSDLKFLVEDLVDQFNLFYDRIKDNTVVKFFENIVNTVSEFGGKTIDFFANLKTEEGKGNLKEQVSNAFTTAKDFVVDKAVEISIKIKEFDYLAFITKGTDTALKYIEEFAGKVVGWFEWIYTKVFGESWWTGMFVQSHAEGGWSLATDLTKYLKIPLDYLATFSQSVVDVFKGTNLKVKSLWFEFTNLLTGQGPQTADDGYGVVENSTVFTRAVDGMKEKYLEFTRLLRAGGEQTADDGYIDSQGSVFAQLEKHIESARKKLLEFKTTMMEALNPASTSGPDDGLRGESIFGTLKESFDKILDTLKIKYSEFVEYVKTKEFGVEIPAFTGLTTNFDSALDTVKSKWDGVVDYISSKRTATNGPDDGLRGDSIVDTLAQKLEKGNRVKRAVKLAFGGSPVKVIVDKLIQFDYDKLFTTLEENGAKGGRMLTAGITGAITAYFLRGTLAKTIRGPVGILGAVIGAGMFVKNSPAFRESIENVAQGWGEIFATFIKDGEGGILGKIGAAVVALADAVSDGFVNGLFPEEGGFWKTTFGDKLSTALTIGVGLLVLSSKTRALLLGIGLDMGTTIANGMFGSKFKRKASTQLTLALGGFLGGGYGMSTEDKKTAGGAQQRHPKGTIINGKNVGGQFKKSGLAVQLEKQGTKAGNAFGRGFSRVLPALIAASVAGSITDSLVSDDAFGGKGAFADELVAGLAAGGIIGSAFGPYGIIGGAILGGLVSVFREAFKRDPTKDSGETFFQSLSRKVNNAINDAVGVTNSPKYVDAEAQAKRELSASGEYNPFEGQSASDAQKEWEKVVERAGEIHKQRKLAFNQERSLNEDRKALEEKISTNITKQDKLTARNILIARNREAGANNGFEFEVDQTALADAAAIVRDERLKDVAALNANTAALKELNRNNITAKPPGFATGGAVRGAGTGTSDDIPAMLSNGEFVMKASAVQKFGPGFMRAINEGKVPQFRSEGGFIGRTVNRTIAQIQTAKEREDRGEEKRLTDLLQELLDITEAQTQEIVDGNEKVKKEAVDKAQDEKDKAESAARKYSDDFAGALKSAMSQALHGGDLEDIAKGLLDTFTSSVINSFVDGFADKALENFDLTSFFQGTEDLGTDTATGIGGLFKRGGNKGDSVGTYGNSDAGGGKTPLGIGEEISNSLGGVFSGFFSGFDGILGNFSGMFGGLTESLGGLFSGLGSSLSGLLGGLGGGAGGGGMGGLVSMGLSLFGMAQGGTVPSTPFSQAGKDSVPTMLMPGEMVLSKNKLASMESQNKQTTQAFNINVQGDVSRQTRKEIVAMMPQIAGGVNNVNKENNKR